MILLTQNVYIKLETNMLLVTIYNLMSAMIVSEPLSYIMSCPIAPKIVVNLLDYQKRRVCLSVHPPVCQSVSVTFFLGAIH